MAAAAVLECRKIVFFNKRSKSAYWKLTTFTFCGNRSNGSRVIALCQFTKWRFPPSWISSKRLIGQVYRILCHRRFFLVKFGGNRLSGLKVIVLCLFSTWRPPPSWIFSNCLFGQFCRIIRHRSFLLVKFGGNRFSGSKVIALCLFSRWRPLPSWILSKCLFWVLFNNTSLASIFVKFDETRFNGSKL